MEPHDYELFPSFWDNSRIRKCNLWSYVDASRVAESVRLALDADATQSGLVHYRGA